MNYKIVYNILAKSDLYVIIFISFTSLVTAFFEFLSVVMLAPATEAISNTSSTYMLPKAFSYFDSYLSSSRDVLTVTTTIIFIAGIFRVVNMYLLTQGTAQIGTSISSRTFKSLLCHDYLYFSEKKSSEVINDLTINVRVCIESIKSLIGMFSSVAIIFAILAAMLFVNTKITLYILCILGAFYLAWFNFTKNIMSSNLNTVNRYLDQHIAIVQQTFASIKEIIIENDQNRISDSFREIDKKLRIKVAQNNFFSTVPRYLIETLIICVFFLYFIFNSSLDGQTSFAYIATFIYSFLRLLPMAQLLFSSAANINANSTSFNRIYELLSYTSENSVSLDIVVPNLTLKLPNTIPQQICLDRISISNGNNILIDEISMIVNFGEFVEVRGPSGCGKSTLLDVIAGLSSQYDGNLFFDDFNASEEPKLIRNVITYLPQTTYLLHDTIRNNIQPPNNFSELKLISATKLAQCYDFVCSLPNKLDHMITENGKNLSGGQRQRLILARAIARNKPILLLDEALSAVDTRTAKCILTNLKRQKSFTIFMINHNPALSALFDKTIDLSK